MSHSLCHGNFVDFIESQIFFQKYFANRVIAVASKWVHWFFLYLHNRRTYNPKPLWQNSVNPVYNDHLTGYWFINHCPPDDIIHNNWRILITVVSHNGRGVSDHQSLECLINSLSSLTLNGESESGVTGTLWRESTGGFPSQNVSNVDSVSMFPYHDAIMVSGYITAFLELTYCCQWSMITSYDKLRYICKIYYIR